MRCRREIAGPDPDRWVSVLDAEVTCDSVLPVAMTIVALYTVGPLLCLGLFIRAQASQRSCMHEGAPVFFNGLKGGTLTNISMVLAVLRRIALAYVVSAYDENQAFLANPESTSDALQRTAKGSHDSPSMEAYDHAKTFK